MNSDDKKSKSELLAELTEVRKRLQELEAEHSGGISSRVPQVAGIDDLLDSLVTPVFYKDTDGRYLGCNTAFETFFGTTKAAMIGKTVYDITTKELADIYDEKDRLLFREHGVQQYESQIRTADGELKEVIFRKSLFYGASGNVAGLVGEIIDITERKHFEKKLQSRLQKQKALAECAKLLLTGAGLSERPVAESLQILLQVVDVGRIYIFENETNENGELCMTQTYEVCAPEVQPELGNPVLQQLPYAQGYARWQSILAKGEYVGGMVDEFPPEEQPVLEEQGILSLLVLPIFIHGEWRGFIGLDDDKRKRHWTEHEVIFLQTAADIIGAYFGHRDVIRELKNSEERFRSYVENANDIIYYISAETLLFDYISPSWKRMMGHEPEEIVGTSFQEYVHPEDIQQCQDFLELVIVSGESQSGVEYRVRRSDGEWCWHTSNAGPVKNEKGEVVGYLGIARDITESKKLARLQDDINTIMRHDLKTPLNGIIGFTQLLELESDFNDRQREMLNIIRDQGYKILRLINFSLDLFKMETGIYEYTPVLVDVLPVLADVFTSLQTQAQKKEIEFVLQLNGSPPTENDGVTLPAEEMLMFSLLNNLVTNAVEASPKGAHVRVEIESEDFCRITITNQSAVPEAIVNRFFEKYVTHGKTKGTGLGTYSAKLMTEIMGGSIELDAGKDYTSVTVTLPAAPVYLREKDIMDFIKVG